MQTHAMRPGVRLVIEQEIFIFLITIFDYAKNLVKMRFSNVDRQKRISDS